MAFSVGKLRLKCVIFLEVIKKNKIGNPFVFLLWRLSPTSFLKFFPFFQESTFMPYTTVYPFIHCMAHIVTTGQYRPTVLPHNGRFCNGGITKLCLNNSKMCHSIMIFFHNYSMIEMKLVRSFMFAVVF
jgi:hypothetical protein